MFVGASLALAVATLLPFASLVAELAGSLLVGERGAVLEPLASARLWQLLATTLLRAGAVTVAALALGVPLGLIVARTDTPGRWPAFALHLLPGLLPPYLLALGWFHLFGRSGMLGNELSARLLFGELGAVAVQALAFAPVVTTLCALCAWGMDASLEDAARVAARPLRVLVRIVLPAAAPGIALAAILVFALALSELGVPMFLRVEAYPAAVFARLGGIDYAPGEAVALVLPLVVIALALLALERRLTASRDYAVLGLRGAGRTPLELGRGRTVSAAGCAVAALLALAPLAALGRVGLAGSGFGEIAQWIGRSVGVSLSSAALAATGGILMGIPLAHALVRGRGGARLPDGLAVLGFVTPAAVLGVGLIGTWNRPSTEWVYGSLAIVVLGFVARYAAVGIRTCASVLATLPPNLEESAAVAGAGYLRRLGRIVLPLRARGLVAAWLLMLVFCLRDLESAVLVYPAGQETLTVRIFTLEANGPEAVVAALACTHVALVVLVLGAMALLIRPRRVR